MASREKSKAEKRKMVATGVWHAALRHLPMSPRKVRVVADCIRGLVVADAMDCLAAVRRSPARPLRSLLHSAVANAENREDVDVDALRVAGIVVHGGRIRRRIRPRAQGRATRIRKRTSHVEVVLTKIQER